MKKSYYIKGMMCAGCSNSVEKSIRQLEGVESATVNLAAENATVVYDESRTGEEKIAEAVRQAGYEMELPNNKRSVTLQIEGMHCAGCVSSVEKSLSSVSGVMSASVNLTTEKAFVEIKESDTTTNDLVRAVERAGYSASVTNGEAQNKLEQKRAREEEKLDAARWKMTFSWIITLPLMVWMFLEMIAGVSITNPTVMELVMTLGAASVIFYPGFDTLKGAWRSAVGLNPNMDVLIAIGTLASLTTGGMALLYHAGLSDVLIYSFSGIAAMIMAFHLTGRYVETKARGRASDAITKLLTLEADQATVVRNGQEIVVDRANLMKDDVMIVRPGEKIPADGTVIDGKCSVNEAMVTGESMPVTKSKGDEVIGGTINTEGAMRVKATRVGEDSFLNQVVKLVEEAQGSKIPIQDFADRITSVFVPVILAVALVTFLGWWLFADVLQPLLVFGDQYLPWILTDLSAASQAFYAALAVLVIACPCALGLATPTALMIGTGLGAENGILIRKGEAIQRMEEVTTFVFDKTGTLTNGHPEVTDLELFSGADLETVAKVAEIEKMSEHPVAKAIVRYFSDNSQNEHPENFESITGMGVRGTVGDSVVAAGNREMMEKYSINIPDPVESRAQELMEGGKTVIYVCVDNMLISLIALRDTVKENASEAIASIHAMGFKTRMITGDQEQVARTIANEIGIKEIEARVKPDGKSKSIKSLQKQGEVVAMVGDGINDAPALAQADVGIALGSGTDIAIESGSIILIKGDLDSVVRAVNLSRMTMKKIRQNLFWALIYNVLMIPAAVIGWMHPVLAEIAMAMSSISVVGNSKRLQNKSPNDTANKF
ncbi:MAG: heavy metal translocating P-type ATPase [Bacteroidetes bacterium]|jgi:Cu+-exporting ATPase|nr:heavy metal translocating P-type ATPase [Bacteroidota bacterium]